MPHGDAHIRRATTAVDDRPRVLVAGGGIAALELLLALRVYAGRQLAITLLTPEPTLAPQAMTVAEPFVRGGALTYDWAEIAAGQDARLAIDRLVAVDTTRRTAYAHGGRRVPYDVLVVATGARRVEPFDGALTFGRSPAAAAQLRAIVDGARVRPDASIAFALPRPGIWSLPLYELALLTAQELREQGSAARLQIVTPEDRVLELFGPAASDAVVPLLDALGVELRTDAQPRATVPGGLRLDGGEVLRADHVVTLADAAGRPIPGLPIDRAGFIPVDLCGRVAGEHAVYAAGEATAFPLRQGGLATQQADAVAASIAARFVDGVTPAPFVPVLRGRLLTSGAPLYLQARPSGQSIASHRALWAPPEKVAGRYAAPYLATARPARIAAEPLSERVPALAGPPDAARDAVVLARTIAAAEERCGNRDRALQALDAACALEPSLAHDADCVAARERLGDRVLAL